MKVLLTFTGFHDPYAPSAMEEEQPGPVLTIAAGMGFDRIYLFSTVRTQDIASRTAIALEERCEGSEIFKYDLPVEDPTNYILIISSIRSCYKEIEVDCLNANYYISTSSGTPQIHSCWLMLAVSGEIPARLLQTRPPQFVTASSPLIKEIDLTSIEFPVIRANVCQIDPAYEDAPDPVEVYQQLGIIGDSPKLKKALDAAALFAIREFPVLIIGETGAGKELFSQAIHRLSSRKACRLVVANCASIPKSLAESYFFGHTKGAFTGAVSDKDGLFKEADGSTLFLDEIGELSLEVQAKLLRVIEDGSFIPVGGGTTVEVDVRIVGATNRDFKQEIKEGNFREDLYQRLNVGSIKLPSLRDRKSDIPRIAIHLLNNINKSTKNQKKISPEALRKLMEHDWSGNIRELKNTLQRSMALLRGRTLAPGDIAFDESFEDIDKSSIPELHEGFKLKSYLEGVKKQLISRALELSGGNKSKAAELLGVSPQHFQKLEKMNQ